MLFDTHAHLDQVEFDPDRDETILRASAAGVTGLVCVGVTLASSEKCLAIARRFDWIYSAAGIHPNYVHEAVSGDWDKIVALHDEPRVVGIGETGLDRHWDLAPFDLQQEYFARHMELSRQRQRPFIVHMRDSEADVLAMLREEFRRGPLCGVMHSFTGGAELAAECVAMGMYISFAGMVTYKKMDDLRACAATIPADRILVETDSPYLSPQAVRGQKRNEPACIVHTAKCVAEQRGLTLEAFAALASANARRFFGIE